MKSITVTTQQSINYGAVLQCYALQQTLIEHGIENEVLRFPAEPKSIYSKLSLRPSKSTLISSGLNVLSFLHRKELLLQRKRFEEFKEKNIVSTVPFYKKEEVLYNTPDADFYLCGSDQVFSSRDKLASVRIMDFIRNNRPKYSFAASIAEYDWDEVEKEFIKEKLDSFTMISVREDYAKNYLGQFIDKKCRVDLDPVFLRTKEQWSELAVDPDINEPYILCYPLLGNENLQKTVDEIKRKTGFKVVCVQPNPIKRIKADKYIFSAGPGEFLGLFKNAQYVVSTSFHGTAFSIIFEKPFSVLIKNYKSQRMTGLLDKLNLSDRIVKDADGFIDSSPDYDSVKKIINEERKSSNKYIDEIIESVSDYSLPIAKNVQTDNDYLCCGCRVCSEICPVNAIEMVEDQKGFAYPQVDFKKCISCGKCVKYCSFRKDSEKKNTIISAYAFQHKDSSVVYKSSSGGAFIAVSDYVLENGGVVYGAVIDCDDFSVRHMRADNKEQRDLMCGSKYVQSDVSGVHNSIKNDLSSGVTVLFSGTPCQCEALKTFLGGQPDNLLIVELLCYGVPSNNLLKNHVHMWEKMIGKHAVNYKYRSKKFGHEHTHEIEFEDGEKVSSIDVSRLLKLYAISVRPSCYECKYDTKNRNGDITIGDMWDAGKRAGIYDHKGTSVLLVNTEKGKNLVKKISNTSRIIEINKEVKGYRALSYPLEKTIKSYRFWDDYNKKGYEYVLDNYADVSIVSRIYRHLIRTLERLGLGFIYEKFIKR